MLRALAAASLLAVLAAGCGGASLQSQALAHETEFLGDPYARAVHIETFSTMDGERDVVAQMRGHFLFVPSCPAPARHHRSRCHEFHTSYAVVEFNLDKPGSGGYWPLSPAQGAAIAAARRSDARFRIFPDVDNVRARCAIPSGAPRPMPLRGSCMTELLQSRLGRFRVLFVESWGPGPVSGGWLVTVGKSDRILDTSVYHRTPPQLWK